MDNIEHHVNESVFVDTIGVRLRAERERLSLSQDAFAKKAGVHRRTQVNYEADERKPDAAYLAAIAGFGVDIAYVVTGGGGGSSCAALAWQCPNLRQLDRYDTC